MHQHRNSSVKGKITSLPFLLLLLLLFLVYLFDAETSCCIYHFQKAKIMPLSYKLKAIDFFHGDVRKMQVVA